MTDYVNRPLVYIAGPYAHPDPVENTHKTIFAADRLNADGRVTAHVPHLTMLWHLVSPHEADYWYAYDLAVLARCDALYRLPGVSSGADNEIAFAKSRSIPVYYELTDLMEWADRLAYHRTDDQRASVNRANNENPWSQGSVRAGH